MKYRTKLYISFLCISLISSILGIAIDLDRTRTYLFNEMRSKVMTASASIASQLDPELVKQIRVLEDERKPEYDQLRGSLRKARDANRRSDIYVKYLYTIYPKPNDPIHFLFGVDPEENEKDVSHAGTEDPGSVPDFLQNHLYEIYSFGKLTKDPWGTWMTGYAPIYDKNGIYVGTIGTDVGADKVKEELNHLYIYAAIALFFSISISIIVAHFLARMVTRALHTLQEATKEIGKGNFAYRVSLDTNDEFQELADSLNQMNEGLEEKERLKAGFAHYVSQHVLERVIKAKGDGKLAVERRKITVFFADIRDFSRLAQTLTAEGVVKFLNEYFKTMLEIILKHNGILDKLIGDAIMAEFGAVSDDPEQEINAVLTALEMQKALGALSEKWKAEGKPTVEVGIGIHTGEAIMGTVGSEERMEYTAIGDTVNIASRLERLTKEMRYPIIVSETTFNGLNQRFPSKHLGLLSLEEREKPINTYAIFPEKKENEIP